MRKLGLVLSLLAVLGLALPWAVHADNSVGPTNQVICNKQGQLTGTGASAQIVPSVAGQLIYICGWHITNTAATGTFQLSFGTGATCTTPTNLTPVLAVSNTAPSADHITAAWASSIAGQTLCVNATVTTVSVLVFYSQF